MLQAKQDAAAKIAAATAAAAGKFNPDGSLLVPDGHWRARVYAARRRVLMLVWGSVRLSATLKRQRRLRRVDSFSFYIPIVLDTDMKRFLVGCGSPGRLNWGLGGG